MPHPSRSACSTPSPGTDCLSALVSAHRWRSNCSSDSRALLWSLFCWGRCHRRRDTLEIRSSGAARKMRNYFKPGSSLWRSMAPTCSQWRARHCIEACATCPRGCSPRAASDSIAWHLLSQTQSLWIRGATGTHLFETPSTGSYYLIRLTGTGSSPFRRCCLGRGGGRGPSYWCRRACRRQDCLACTAWAESVARMRRAIDFHFTTQLIGWRLMWISFPSDLLWTFQRWWSPLSSWRDGSEFARMAGNQTGLRRVYSVIFVKIFIAQLFIMENDILFLCFQILFVFRILYV